MKVFLSWSGSRSKAIAEVVRNWLPSVLQAVRPYFSPDDVSKGSRWSTEIAKELEASRVALLFITADNAEAAWLVFEAGALSKNLDSSRVCPLLFGGIEPTDIEGPLIQFQAAKFDKAEIKRVLKMVNTELGESALPSDVLDSVFEMWWPKLEQQVAEALQNTAEESASSGRPDRELLEEILALSRRNVRADPIRLDHPAIRDLTERLVAFGTLLRAHSSVNELHEMFFDALTPLSFILTRGAERPPSQHLKMLKDLRNTWRLSQLLENDEALPVDNSETTDRPLDMLKDLIEKG